MILLKMLHQIETFFLLGYVTYMLERMNIRNTFTDF